MATVKTPLEQNQPDRGKDAKSDGLSRAPQNLIQLTEPAGSLRSLQHAFAGRSSAWIERTVRDREVAGSNPVAPIFAAQRQK